METAMWPIGYARDVSVLHRIEMNVVDMAIEIGVITNCVLPISPLPNTFFTFDNFTRRSRLCIETS